MAGHHRVCDSVNLNAQSDVTTCVESEADVVWPATELVPNTMLTNNVIVTLAVRIGLSKDVPLTAFVMAGKCSSQCTSPQLDQPPAASRTGFRLILSDLQQPSKI